DEQTVDIWSERPDTATLTKGFSIPTYLPPFPDFIPADLPQTTVTSTVPHTKLPSGSDNTNTNSNSNGNGNSESNGNVNVNDIGSMQSLPNKQQPQQPRLHAYDSEKKEQELRRAKQLARERQQLPRRQLSLPSRNVTVQLGQHAYLPCQLHQHSSKPLSWVRLRDEHIIAVDHTTFINDARFAALLQSSSSSSSSSSTSSSSNVTGSLLDSANGSSLSWTLLIKYVQLQDNGWYECQLATEPKMSAKVQLLVITPRTELVGDKQRFVKAGSRVELLCVVRGTLEEPKYIVWYRGDHQVMADNDATGVDNGWYTQIDRKILGNTEHNRNTVCACNKTTSIIISIKVSIILQVGTLVIPVVRKSHSGNYTCEPENSQAVSIQLHVLSGEYSASAIKSMAAGLHRHGRGYSSLHQWLIFLLVALNKT
ncbi:hypothetical protein KR044_012920, partial [Drosophila immigrans]